MNKYELKGQGLAGKLDLGIIRYVPELTQLCSFIDHLMIGDDYEGDCTLCDFSGGDYTAIGQAALGGLFNEDYIVDTFENMKSSSREELLDSLKLISDEFRRWKFASSFDDTQTEEQLGGQEIAAIYADVWAAQQALGQCEPNERGVVLSRMVLGYIYKHHGEALSNLFKVPINYFEQMHTDTILNKRIVYSASFIVSTYQINLEVGV